MPGGPRFVAALAVLVLAAVACDPAPSSSPAAIETPAATPGPSSTAPGPTTTPGPSPAPTTAAITTPLAVVTGLPGHRSTIAVSELRRLADDRQLRVLCGVEVTAPDGFATAMESAACVELDVLRADVRDDPEIVGLVPPGVVEPALRALPIEGDGPFGTGGPDLFGNAAARALPYPIEGVARGLPGEWTAYDAADVWTLVSLGDTCPDRGPAYAAITQGRGWDWVMDGGTARYLRIYRNFNPPPGIDPGHLVVEAEATGNAGAVAALASGADVTIDDFECPVVDPYTPNLGTVNVFSVDPEVVTLLRDKLGVDVAYMAANHMSDKGSSGIRSTLLHFDRAGIAHTGLGQTLEEALAPAVVEVGSHRLGFVSFNDVPGAVAADADTPGVAWLTRDNVLSAVSLARDEGAEVVFCDPQWWGGAEYHADFNDAQREQLGWFDEAGCDHVLGAGTHWSGPLLLRGGAGGGAGGGAEGPPSLVMVSQGNFLFGQRWDQAVQEGVVVELGFRGVALATVRLHPYIMLQQAKASLIDPETDGRDVLERVFRFAELP